jgi:hypothetical protein
MSGDESHGSSSPRSRVVLETLGEFWCEASVLVAVFGLLDKVMKYEELTLAWAGKTLGCAILLLVTGAACRMAVRP